MYLMIAHVPIGSLSEWHHLPHDYAKTPHVTGWRKLPMRDRLWCRPTNRNFASLKKKKEIKITIYEFCINASISWK